MILQEQEYNSCLCWEGGSQRGWDLLEIQSRGMAWDDLRSHPVPWAGTLPPSQAALTLALDTARLGSVLWNTFGSILWNTGGVCPYFCSAGH